MFDYVQNFLTTYEKVVDIVKFAFFVILSLLLYAKTKNINFLTEVVDEMKLRNANYNCVNIVDEKTGEVIGQKTTSFAQTFDNFKPVYRLNEVMNELEKTDEVIDIQEVINSCKDCCLDAILEKFLPPVNDTDNMIADYSAMRDDLDYMTEAIERAEDYREKFGLDDKMSVKDIYDYVKEKSASIKTAIDNAQVVKKDKEILENEKKETVEESK